MSLFYSMREGFAGFRRARFATLASTLAIVVALSLIGAMGLIGYHAERITGHLRAQSSEIEVFLTDPDPARARSVGERLESLPGVSSARFISQEEAEMIFRTEFGDEGNVFLGEHFLPASFKVQMARGYAHVDSLNELVASTAQWAGVDEVIYNQPLLSRVQENLRLASVIAAVVGLLVMLASMTLVANTIRLTIYARRLLIRTMKLVGATDRFVRRPFLFEGLYQGLLAGLIAGVIVVGLHQTLLHFVPLLEGWPGGHPAVTLGAMILLGSVLGWLGSRFAARRFIRKVHLH